MTDIIYIIRCIENKYYVGRTNNLDKRLSEHFNGTGSEWTKKYRCVNVIQTIKGDRYDEDKYVIQYMKKYGIENVRGGSFTQIILPNDEITVINKMLNNADNKCYRCGLSGHFIKNCKMQDKNINQFVHNNTWDVGNKFQGINDTQNVNSKLHITTNQLRNTTSQPQNIDKTQNVNSKLQNINDIFSK